jgi:hypothetical protein
MRRSARTSIPRSPVSKRLLKLRDSRGPLGQPVLRHPLVEAMQANSRAQLRHEDLVVGAHRSADRVESTTSAASRCAVDRRRAWPGSKRVGGAEAPTSTRTTGGPPAVW